MKIIESSFSFIQPPSYDELLIKTELAGRTCYKSEDKIGPDSAEKFVRMLISSGHESVIECCSISVRIICDRATSHQLVRHRLSSFSQESQRYCRYDGSKSEDGVVFIKPSCWPEDHMCYHVWEAEISSAEEAYLLLLSMGARSQEARKVLPNSTKTELVMTCNLRQWRHVFKERCQPAADQDTRELMCRLRGVLIDNYPAFFEDLVK